MISNGLPSLASAFPRRPRCGAATCLPPANGGLEKGIRLFLDGLALPALVVLVPATLAPSLPGNGFIGATSALAGCLPFLPDFFRVESGCLFSFRLLVPGLIVYATCLVLFLWGLARNSGLPYLWFLGLWLPDLPGFFLWFGPG